MPRSRILWVDASAGASGDMILGALVDLGVPLARIRQALASLPLSGWKLVSRRVHRAGLLARKVDVQVEQSQPARTWRDIRRILGGGKLEAAVLERSLGVFRALVEAEAQVHGVRPDAVHLHEVGAVDAIVDIVGACAGFAHLDADRIVVSPMTTGFGTVRCEHGTFPVPAPATALLVRGALVRGGEVEGERLTPTGAALLTTLADAWGPLPACRPLAVGCGAGSRELEGAPNVLRMVLAEAQAPALKGLVAQEGQVLAIEVTVDDAPPQVLAYATERLFVAGALDVYTAPVHMKKGRTGHHLTVLARPSDLEALAGVILKETTSLGLRFRQEGRIELERRIERVRTRYGTVRIKVGLLAGRRVQAWPEYEDCAALARREGIPLKEVQHLALEAHRAATRERGRESAAARENR